MTAVEFAKEMGYDYSTVMRWLRDDIVPGADFLPINEKFGVWRIPEEALKMEKPRAGRKRGWRKDAVKKTAKKKTTKKGGVKK